ncbi:DUF5071 domain-containing protein [Brevibacillus invocatus]|uniref:DUF5071 domain-containing protein n=1 Tax=Brevibacillus invocatus TaxID=173959 RepID=A0A3M8BW97_9BACL|nr:DUF5071 domain-containing protein [Brevibacillus invocatus]RNB67711.1 DUF5071 domain-containing protein [Brevibacillus invocatus]
MNVRDFIPQHKMDHEKTGQLKKLDKDLIRSVIPELMTWLQDGNWPVYPEIRDVLLPLGNELVPHIRYVLETTDEDWKYFVLTGLVSKLSKETIVQMKPELIRIAYNPSESEAASELDEVARELLRHSS